MRMVFTLDQRYDSTPDGAVWVKAGPAYQYWAGFLDVFDSVSLVARVRYVPSVPADMHRVDGAGVSVSRIPYYLGPWQYLFSKHDVDGAACKAVNIGDAVVLCGGPFSDAIETMLRRIDYPYAVNVVGDPYDVLAPGAIKHPLRSVMRIWCPHKLRRQCAGAVAGIYVTKEALQRRYPCPAYSVGVSDVDLPDDVLMRDPRPVRQDTRQTRLIMVGTLAQLYKAPDVLIKSVAACVRKGLDLSLVMVGDGKHRPELEALSARLGIADRAMFLGQLPAGSAVRDELDRADLFVLASHQEGLPRAMVEAMARALPCIGSTVGGIPELLPAEDMVPPGDAGALARKITEVVQDPKRMARMSARSLNKAQDYRASVLLERRLAFYGFVRERTEEWLKSSDR
jgi:glycosyltransferase involved in cell wall biosynthesis